MRRIRSVLATLAAFVGVSAVVVAPAGAPAGAAPPSFAHNPRTPIKHLVVIFQENVSFDHYFGTYPNAANTSGQTFHKLLRARRRSTA